MAKKFCSFCCCTSSPQSSQQQQPISSPTPTQSIAPPQSSQQQQPISSPTPPQTIAPPQSSQQQQPISSPTPPQTIAPPQSSQQQQTISSPTPQTIAPPQQSTTPLSSSSAQDPTPTMTDFKMFLQKFNDISQIETLISLLEDLLKIASGEKSDDGGSSSAAPSFIQDGQGMMEMLNRRIGKRPVKKSSGEDTVEEIEKVSIELLKGSEKIPQVGIALCMLGSVLDRFIKARENKKECLDVLERLVDLGKLILKLNEQIPEQKEKLDEGVQRIIVGTIMCISQLARPTIFSFFTATVNKESLNAFQLKLDRLCQTIQLLTSAYIVEKVSDIAGRVPKLGSESQKLYAYQQTVGIEDAQNKVIELLDLNAQYTIPVVVVVHGFGGIGKTTIADAVYAQLNLQSYEHCRIHMDQDCTKNDIKGFQEQILNGLFQENIKLKNLGEGQGRLWEFFKNSLDKPLFLYIDNGLKSTDLKQLLPKDLDRCLPPKSRILITTRNLDETDLFVVVNIDRRAYDVNPLPDAEAKELLLKKVSEYNDKDNIVKLLKLCGGVPLLLELAGSQLANGKNIWLEMLNEGEEVKKEDISDRMVGFVYDKLLPCCVQEAFLDITALFFDWESKYVSSIVGEEEFRALEAASFVKTDEYGRVIVHDIIRARGKWLADQEGNRIRDDHNTLLECLKDDERLKKLRGIYFDEENQPAIEINCHHLNCMSVSLRVLWYRGSQITFREKCQKSFGRLRCLIIDVPDLPMPNFEKLEHLVYYEGPFTQGMNLYEFPPSLRFMYTRDYSSENRVEYSKIPPKVTPPSSLVKLGLEDFKNMQRLPDGVEKLTKLETLSLLRCNQLSELPSELTHLSNLRRLILFQCKELKELPSDFGHLQNLNSLSLLGCSGLAQLPSDFGQLQNLNSLNLSGCSGLAQLPSNFGQLQNLNSLNLWDCSGLAQLPSDFGQLQNLKMLELRNCSMLEEWPLSFAELTQLKEINLEGCSSKLKDSLSKYAKGNNWKVIT